jgi:hypothetical protein
MAGNARIGDSNNIFLRDRKELNFCFCRLFLVAVLG